MGKALAAVLCGEGANRSIEGLLLDYAAALNEAGVETVRVMLEDAELRYLVEMMQRGEISFAMTWLGLGQGLAGTVGGAGDARNVFEHFNIPLVKVHGDLPAYYIDLHRDVPRNSINLYQAEEFVRFRQRWLKDAHALTSTLPPMAMIPMERWAVDLKKRRQGKLFFVKNGNSPEELEEMWRTRLPAAMGRIMHDMARTVVDEALDRPVDLGDWVGDFLESTGIAAEPSPRLVWFYAAQLDDYLRRTKSTMIARAILDLPVIVQGSFWDHVDFTGRRAQRVEGTDVFASQRIHLDELGIIDMSANVDSWPHDRVQRSAGSYSLVITNEQGWLSRAFPEFTDLTYRFDPGSIADRVNAVLTNPDRFLELSVEFGERFRTVYPRRALAEKVLPLVEQTRVIWQRPPIQLQKFFVWTQQ